MSSLDVAGRLLPVVPAGGSSPVGIANPAGTDGPVVAGGPVGPCGTLSPLFQEVLGPLDHSVLDHAGPAGQHVAVGPVGPLRTLSPSDCHPAGPAGPYVAGGPVDPDGKLKVLEPLEHSVLDHSDPAGQHAVIQEVLEPLEHSVLDTSMDGQPMEGTPVLEPLEHSVLEMTLDGGPLEEMSTVSAFSSECNPGWSTYGGDTGSGTVRAFCSGDGPGQWTHGGDITFRTVRAFGFECRLGRSTYGGDPSSGIVRAFDSGVDPGWWTCGRDVTIATARAFASECSPGQSTYEGDTGSGTVREFGSGYGPGQWTHDGGPELGPDRKLTFSAMPHEMRNDDLVLGAAVPLPAENVGRVTLSPAEVRLGAGDVYNDDNSTVGLQCWNTEGDVLDQYETFNGMPVYYGGDMYDSEDSDWDDPYALASAAYVEDYNFDVPEGMDLMVHRHSRDPDSLNVQRDCHTDVAPVCQTVSCVARDEWDMFDDDSLAEAADVDGPNIDEFY